VQTLKARKSSTADSVLLDGSVSKLKPLNPNRFVTIHNPHPITKHMAMHGKQLKDAR
jgi:predicted GTPase